MADLIRKYEGVVFHLDAVISDDTDYCVSGPMPRIREAFKWLADEGYRLFLAAYDTAKANAALNQFDLSGVFMHAGTPQICRIERDERAFSELDPPIYWKELDRLQVGHQQNLLAITSTHDGIISARRTGISHVIGYYGSPGVPFGKSLQQRELLTRGRCGVGTKLLMANYSELPERMWVLRPGITGTY